MNPVDLYHDPALDNMITQSKAPARTNGSTRRSNNSAHRRSASENLDFSALPPTAPEVPRGPPISYRGLGPAEPDVHRSFSQRASGRPFAKEAFADQELARSQDKDIKPRISSTGHQGDALTSTTRKPAPSEGLRLNTSNLNGTAAVPAPRREIQTAREPPVDKVKPVEKIRRTSDTPRKTEEPFSAVSRSSAFRDEAQRRDWAPDRSPLQKLEVTLNDISKEEKRARVQEAEMMLRDRDAKLGRAPVESPRDKTSPATQNSKVGSTARRSSAKRERIAESDAQPVEDGVLVRNLSMTQRERLQHSTTVDNHRPDIRRLSGEKHPGFEYTISAPLYDQQPGSRRPSHKYRREDASADQPVKSSKEIFDEAAAKLEKSSSSKQREVSRSIPDGLPADDLPPRRTLSKRRVDPTATRSVPSGGLVDRERNASHKAALEKLTGVSPPVAKNGSRKLQKTPPASGETARAQASRIPSRIPVPIAPSSISSGGIENSNRALDHSDIESTATYNRPFTPIGHGMQPSPHPSSPQSPPQRVADVTRQRQRKSSVSFKEPMSRRPVDEWKEAGIARLTSNDFLNESIPMADRSKPWWEQGPTSANRRGSRSNRPLEANHLEGPIDDKNAEFKPKLFLRCGPLLRYTGLKSSKTENGGSKREIWRGSVMIVTQDSHSSYDTPPTLRLFARPQRLLPPPPDKVAEDDLNPGYVDPVAGLIKLSRTGRALYVRPVDHLEEGKDLSQVEGDDGLFESSPSPLDLDGSHDGASIPNNKRIFDQDGERLGRYQEVKGARLFGDPDRDVTFWRFNIEVELQDEQQHIAYRINRGPALGFWVPAQGETMNIMFHSCNGFSLSVNPDNFSGPDPLWRDVLNTHQTRPFHVMIGGGDQIYNDRVILETQHFGEWTRMRNPTHKHHALFTHEMKEELETFYLNRYAMWFSQGMFGMAASQIPMVNMWDDHDIIDGFGSYPNHFMETPVFSGLGNVAFKYYMLFQHQSVPEETPAHEPSWLLGREPGPYIKQLSRSVFMQMGKHVAFLGLDCRTERMRNEVLSVDTMEIILERCRKELVEGETKHLIVLLGVPIAYPRLVWLENMLTSRFMDPVKALGRVGILKGGFLNKFDGGVEILDDLDDHWTATNHKHERNDLVKDLQDLAAEKSCRVTILSGDVHLGAIGQFHSNPKLKIPKDRDHRYMPNIISSAIVNTPPSDMVADILNKRNKTHHLDKYTDENMIPMFTHDVDSKKRNNKHMLPRRNWCSIREYVPGSTPPPSPPESPEISEDEEPEESPDLESQPRRFSFTKEDVNPRALFRRLSSRKAPPTSYRDAMYEQDRAASYDGTSRPQGHSGPLASNASGSRQSSTDFQPVTGKRASSFDHNSSGIPVRPGMFQRRPTNFSEKAARKGNVPAIDAEGNEIDVNDSVNLEGGLDIVLNMEINQKDPSGITMPYRLLIPALWYDGSSDREKLDEVEGVQRRPTFLNRIGLGAGRSHKAARKQGDGNWGQTDTEDESYDEEDDVQQKAQPRRRFSLFGSRRRNQPDYTSETESDQDDGPSANQQGQFPPKSVSGNTASQPDYNVSHNMTGPPSHDFLYDTSTRPPPSHSLAPAAHPSTHRSLTITSSSRQPSQQTPQGSHFKNHRESQQTQPSSSAIADFGSGHGSSSGRQGATEWDAHGTSSGHYPSTTSTQRNPSVSPHEAFADAPPVGTGGNFPQRRLSKQERILGISSSDPQPQVPPQALRGNGIIGKQYGLSSPVGLSGGRQPAPGYTGIEAYKEPKPRRGFSLRKARDWLDGRGRGGQDDFD